MASTKQRNIKPADDDSDAFTEPDEEEETRPMPRRSKGKKRVSDIHGTMTVPLNDIQNAGDETESDDEERNFARQKLKARTSTIDLNDDTAEKRKRRKSAKQSVAFINPLDASEREAAKAARAEKSRASGANRETTPERPTNTGAGPRTPKVSALARANQLNAVAQTPVPAVPIDILTSKYEEWMKLATDNKINANNAWNFALIDYFQDMSLLRNELDNSINFQKASFTLDGCVKIWTSRVDSVGTETGKLLNNLADDIRAAQSDSEEQQDEEGEGKAKKQKQSHRTESTLAKSFAQLQVKKLDLEFTVDPLFKKTCADFDEGGAMGLLMNHLAVDEQLRVVFDAGDSKLEGVDEETPDIEPLPVDLSELRSKFIPSVDTILAKTITESLGEFRFSKDATADIGFINSFTQNNEDDGDDGAGDAFGDVPMQDNFGDDDAGFPDGDAPAPEDFFTGDQAIEDNFAANQVAFGETAQQAPMALGPVERFDPRRLPSERDLVMAMAEDGDDMLDYFDAAVMKNWAGPEHWKLRRPIKKADPSGEDAPAPRARKEKVAFQIDFHSAPLSSKELFAPATTSITLPAGTGATISGPSTARRKSKKNAAKRDQFLLPDDMHFSSAQLLRLFRKPTFMDQPDYTSLSDTPDDANVVVDLGCLLALVGEVGDGEIDERFWANAAAEHAEQQQQGEDGDETGPIPFNTQFFHDDYDDGDGPAFDEDYHEGQSALPRAEEEDFLAAAQGQLKRTRPEFVQYAKKAKRVDVRKLKQNIWKSLDIVTGRLEDEDEEDAPVPDRPPTDPTEARPFENVIGKLQSAYPREKMEEISTSFCFICLLHLANEQGLKLEVGGKEESAMAIDEEAESERRVGDLFGVKVYRDPNAVPSA